MCQRAYEDDLSIGNDDRLFRRIHLTQNHCLAKDKAHKLMSLRPDTCRLFQQIVCIDALPGDPSHGLVCGNKNNRRILEGLRDSALWVIPPEAPTFESIQREARSRAKPEET